MASGDELSLPGTRVVRGGHWKWDQQDGGEGGMGTFIQYSDDKTEAIVSWDKNGVKANYRCSVDVGGFDLRIIDNSACGIVWPNSTCQGCQASPIKGMLWTCTACTTNGKTGRYELCTTCYHGNKHNTAHQFFRQNSPKAQRSLLSPRSSQQRTMALGICEGATVSRGRDWSHGDEDGNGNGKVMRILEDEKVAGQCVEVRWEETNKTKIYPIGLDGKIQLIAIQPKPYIEYYAVHLPVLKGGGGVVSSNVANLLGSEPGQRLFDMASSYLNSRNIHVPGINDKK